MSTSNANSAAATSSLRPRAKRLISGLSDDNEAEFASPSQTPLDGSRAASPIPPAHPQRTTPNFSTLQTKFSGSSWGRRAQVSASRNGPVESPTTSPSLGSLWGTSWSALQGFASEFVSNDFSASGGGNGATAGQPKRAKSKFYRQRTQSPNQPSVPREWGAAAPTSHPAAAGDIGSGTREAREAAVRAAKRKEMLQRADSSYADALGKFKRRLSDDHESVSAPPSEGDDRAALVYIHHVQKDDTLAGVAIKYNCSANVLRRANRMWAHDTAQSRQTLVLPVDACGVKGKPIASPDLLGSEPDADPLSTWNHAEEIPPPAMAAASAHLINGAPRPSLSSPRESISTASELNGGGGGRDSTTQQPPPWHHDSWTQLPNFSHPTEIARLSRRTLGYFPPARRKSIGSSTSARNTPSVSLDLARTGTATYTSPTRPSMRPRKSSNATTGYYPTYLSGPGGVGTLSRNVHSPGPAQDGLNKMFARHLPDVAPPKNQRDLYLPELPLSLADGPGDAGEWEGIGRAGGGNGLGLENVGGAIESWVRRLATKATTPSAAAERRKVARASVGTPGKGVGGVGDLIEMTDEFELGDDDEGEEAIGFVSAEEEGSRGRQQAAGGSSGAHYFGNQGVRGRKSGKDD